MTGPGPTPAGASAQASTMVSPRRGPARGAARRRPDGGASGIESGLPSTRPADVIGSWATTQPPGRTASPMRRSTTSGVDDVEQEEAAEREVDRLRQEQVLARLGDRDHLGVGRGRSGHLVARAWGSLSTA